MPITAARRAPSWGVISSLLLAGCAWIPAGDPFSAGTDRRDDDADRYPLADSEQLNHQQVRGSAWAGGAVLVLGVGGTILVRW